MKNIAVILGDKRQRELAKILNSSGYMCIDIDSKEKYEANKSFVSVADTIILPIPITKDRVNIFCELEDIKIEMSSFFQLLEKEKLIIGGVFPETVCTLLKNEKMSYLDLFKKESFVIYNAYLTAQGVVKIICENIDSAFNCQKVLITGFGKVAFQCAKMLSSLGFNVAISARNEAQRETAKSLGYATFDNEKIENYIYMFDIVVSTVPHNIISRKALEHMKDNSLYIELASAPFGAEKKNFKNSKARYILGASLPGKMYPQASARVIFNYIKPYI